MSSQETQAGGPPPARKALPGLGIIMAAVLLGSAGLVVILAEATAPTAAFLRCWIAVVVLAPLAVLELRRHGRFPPKAIIIAAVSGAALGIDYVLWAQSVLDAGLGVSTVLISVQVIVFPCPGLDLRRQPARVAVHRLRADHDHRHAADRRSVRRR